jgi:hypothetical protein
MERDHFIEYDDGHRAGVSDGLLSMTLFGELYQEVL